MTSPHYCQEATVAFNAIGKQTLRLSKNDGGDGRTVYLRVARNEHYVEIAYCDKDHDVVRLMMFPRESIASVECAGWVAAPK